MNFKILEKDYNNRNLMLKIPYNFKICLHWYISINHIQDICCVSMYLCMYKLGYVRVYIFVEFAKGSWKNV
jgi:hypothetical protein